MALQRNVVYTVTRWMSVWVNAWMDVAENTEAHMRGPEQELDACLITVSFFFFYGINVLVLFSSSCTGEKKGLLRKPCRHEDSPVLFCHFFPWTPLLLCAHFVLCEATSKLSVRHQVSSFFFLPCFYFLYDREGRGLGGEKIKMSKWKLVLRLRFTPPPSRSFYKQLSAHPQTADGYCERGGTEVETATAERNRRLNDGLWWSTHTYMCHAHIKRHSKVTQSQ